jgi:hypothetical protein
MRWPPAPRDFADAVARVVRGSFVRDGFLAPVAFVFAARNPLTGQHVEPTILTFALVGPASSFASQLRALARDVEAPMLLQAYEVRMIGTLAEQPSRGYESLENAPEARDCVVLLVEHSHAAAPLAWVARIRLRGTPTLDAFEEEPVGRVEGWLTAILPLVS